MTCWRQAQLPQALPDIRKKRLFAFLMLNSNIRFSAKCAADPDRKGVNELSPWGIKNMKKPRPSGRVFRPEITTTAGTISC
jgi:hypothetical protein